MDMLLPAFHARAAVAGIERLLDGSLERLLSLERVREPPVSNPKRSSRPSSSWSGGTPASERD
ncbi:MAG TPA: hypothetical protein VFX49_15370 [Chloroflexota bacterium]|nr:hypothetical protein [Chloroflexota bacterium]